MHRPTLPSSQSSALTPARVLIVDDHADTVDALSDYLVDAGYQVVSARDGESALESIKTFAPDIALLDIALPSMDGYELARRLREQPQLRALRYVALTAYCQAADRARAKAEGFDAYVVKPDDLDALVETLSMLLERRSG